MRRAWAGAKAASILRVMDRRSPSSSGEPIFSAMVRLSSRARASDSLRWTLPRDQPRSSLMPPPQPRSLISRRVGLGTPYLPSQVAENPVPGSDPDPGGSYRCRAPGHAGSRPATSILAQGGPGTVVRQR
jgi:hypothetical protein